MYIIRLIFVFLIVVSCRGKRFETKETLLSYVRDSEHGYYQEKSVRGYNFSLLYKPTDLLVSQELGSSIEESKVSALREKYSNYLYFVLSISKDNKDLLRVSPKTREDFGSMVHDLSFGMGNHVHLYTSDRDTLGMLDYVYPRYYGMMDSTSFLFVYPRDRRMFNSEYLHFTVGDLGLYTGEVKFKIGTELIEREPSIKFKEKKK